MACSRLRSLLSLPSRSWLRKKLSQDKDDEQEDDDQEERRQGIDKARPDIGAVLTLIAASANHGYRCPLRRQSAAFSAALTGLAAGGYGRDRARHGLDLASKFACHLISSLNGLIQDAREVNVHIANVIACGFRRSRCHRLPQVERGRDECRLDWKSSAPGVPAPSRSDRRVSSIAQ